MEKLHVKAVMDQTSSNKNISALAFYIWRCICIRAEIVFSFQFDVVKYRT